MSTINNDIPFVPENTTDPAAGLNLSLNVIDALLQIAVVAIQNDPPMSPTEGQRYIVGPAGTGDWAGQDNRLARYLDGSWSFYDARIAVNLATGSLYFFDGTTWADASGAAGTALQPGDNVSELTNDAGYITSSSVITDHGALTGLGDDDHTQYHTDARGDARYVQSTTLAQPSGVATLDASGKLLNSQIPAVAISDTFVVASQVAMLALTAETGDVAVRTDLSQSYILTANDPSALSNWQELLSPTDSVSSVNGQTGAVVLNADDIDDTTTANKFASQSQLDAADGALQAVNNLSDLASASTARTNLGLGTAAVANVTTSDTDTNTARVTRPGNFGLGAFNASVNIPNNNLDSLRTNGIWRTLDTTTGRAVDRPSQVLHMGQAADIAVQFLMPTTGSTDAYLRNISLGSPSAWVRIYHTGNLTGAVSTIATSNLTANRAAISDGSGKVAVSSVTSTELALLSGKTSLQSEPTGTPTKGDISVYNGSAWVRLPAGANGTVLTANSATSTGLEWV